MDHPLEISNSRTLHRLLYASRYDMQAGCLDGEVDAILAASVRNNAEVEVTGFLLIGPGWFLQALEGPAKAVMTTYGRILSDPRHTRPVLISSGPVSSRAFAAWSMCAAKLGEVDRAILATLDKRGELDPARLDRASALSLLQRVAQVQSRAVARGAVA